MGNHEMDDEKPKYLWTQFFKRLSLCPQCHRQTVYLKEKDYILESNLTIRTTRSYLCTSCLHEWNV